MQVCKNNLLIYFLILIFIMDRVREGKGVGLSLPPAGGDSFLEPNGSQINEILIHISIFIYIIIFIFISRSLQGRVASRFVSLRFKVRSHRIAPGSDRKHDGGDDDDSDDDDDDGDGDDDGDDGDDDDDGDDGGDVALPQTCFPVRADLRPFVEQVPHICGAGASQASMTVCRA